jgi:hypothetical protein
MSNCLTLQCSCIITGKIVYGALYTACTPTPAVSFVAVEMIGSVHTRTAVFRMALQKGQI